MNLIENVVSFLDETIKEKNIKIDQTEGILKQQLQKRMNPMRYKKQSKQIKHQRKKYYINENSKILTT